MIEQRSPEWFEQRKGMITGSRAGAILGVSPLQTKAQCLRAMVREILGASSEFNGNVATEYGNFNEEYALADLQMDYGIRVDPAEFSVHSEIDWLGASPDGLVGKHHIVEVKCPFGLRDEDNPEFKKLSDLPHYYAQVQLEMACTGRKNAYFFQWTAKGYDLELVKFDQDWFDLNLPVLDRFREELAEAVANPKEYLEDLVLESDKQKELVHQYAIAKAKLADIEAEVDMLRKALIEAASGRKTVFASEVDGEYVTVYPSMRKGSVQYAKAVKDLIPDADLTAYTGAPSTVWNVR